MPFNRSSVVALVAACTMLSSVPGQGAFSPSYPVKPVRLIIANTPGTSVDALARVLGVRLGEELGAQIVPDNRAGAGGLIGGEIASRSAADGYTLLVSSTGMQVITPQIYKGLNYDPIRDFVPLSLVAITQNVLVVTPSLPVQSVQELIAHAKANPGKLNMSNAGSGFQSHLAGVLFTHLTGINVQHVPYKGGASLVAVIGNEAQVTIAPMPAVIGHVRAGKLRAIATGGEKRSVATATLPTIIEAGVPGYVSTGWMGLMLPAGPSRAGPPKPLFERLRAVVVKVVDDPVTREQMERQGGEAMSSTPEAFLQLIREEYKRFQIAIGLAGLKVD
jgi:tripartite-type tricarboxylate transporter receptor subunit TctC